MRIIKEQNNDFGFPYVAYIPDNINDHPALLIQLHGAGERGDGSDLDNVTYNGFCKIINDNNLKNCILLAPQCPKNSFWVAKIETLKFFIDNAIAKYSADTNRIYLCGLSMGGYGTWYTAMAYPKLFAAIAPCCGGAMAWNAGVLKMPIWAFHGKEDTVVSPFHTMEMIEKLEGKNPNFKYNLYDGVAHNSWEKAFSEQLLEWLLDKEKKNN